MAGPGSRQAPVCRSDETRRRPVRRPEPVRVLDRHRTPGRVLRGVQPTPAPLSRQPPRQPRHPHRRGHPAAPEHRRAGLLQTQACPGQEAPRSDEVPQAQDLRRPLSPARHRRRSRSRRGHEGGSGRAPRGVSCIQRGRLTPAHRHFGSATSRTRTTDATPDGSAPEDPPRSDRLTTEGSRCDAGSRGPPQAPSLKEIWS